MTSDRITLTLPRERQFFGVANLVVGGLAVRLDLSFEQLEDLQVALTELLEHPRAHDGEVTVAVTVGEREIETAVGPLDDDVATELRREAGSGVGLRRVLDAVVDAIEVTDRDGEPWVSLRKSIERNGSSA